MNLLHISDLSYRVVYLAIDPTVAAAAQQVADPSSMDIEE